MEKMFTLHLRSVLNLNEQTKSAAVDHAYPVDYSGAKESVLVKGQH